MLKTFIVLDLMILFWMGTLIDANHQGMQEIFKWKQISFQQPSGSLNRPYKNKDFVFPDSDEHFTDPATKPNAGGNTEFDYTPGNSIPMGVSHHKGRLFITLPRRRPGVPATLNTIDLLKLDANDKSPKLTGYPSFAINSLQPNAQPDRNRIVSVYRTRVDSCNRLWFIDTGMLEYPNNRTQIQPPAIWIMNLDNDQFLRRFEIPPNIVDVGRGLASITVDVTPTTCDDAFAYIPDLFSYGLHVYSFRSNSIWRFDHNYFSFDPLAGDLKVGGQSFQWNDGIFSLTLGGPNPDGFRTAYFHSMCSHSEFGVSTKVLRESANAARDSQGEDFQHLGSRGTLKQSTMHDFDPKTGTIFYTEISRNGIGCWNSKKKFTSTNFDTVYTDPTMIYPSDLTVDADGNIWAMSNSLPIFIYSALDPNVYNFKVWKQNGRTATKGTLCE